jgi:hypothetical protein
VTGVERLATMRVSYALPKRMAGWEIRVESDAPEHVRVKAPGHAELKLSRVAWLQMLIDYGALLLIKCPAGWSASWDKDHLVVQHDSGSMCGHTEADKPRAVYPALNALASTAPVAAGGVVDTRVWTAAFVNKLREEAAEVLNSLLEARGESKRNW